MKASVLLFLWLSFLFYSSSCSSAAGVNNAATTNANHGPAGENQEAGNVSAQSNRTAESSPSAKPKEVVSFDGKNYIKKSGWKTPPKKDTYVDESYDQGNVEGRTEKGKQVRTTTLLYGYRTSQREETGDRPTILRFDLTASEVSEYNPAQTNGKENKDRA